MLTSHLLFLQARHGHALMMCWNQHVRSAVRAKDPESFTQPLGDPGNKALKGFFILCPPTVISFALELHGAMLGRGSDTGMRQC